MKATHIGTCQVCGRSQKLPSGRLSLHGYTKQWGFFNGTCPGAGHLPFEQDIALIQGAITRAQDSAKELRSLAKSEIKRANPEDCWVHAYFPAISRQEKGGSRWIQSSLHRDKYNRVCYIQPAYGNRPSYSRQMPFTTAHDLDAIAKEQAQDYAEYLEKQACEYDEYVAWQERRIFEWEPKELQLIQK